MARKREPVLQRLYRTVTRSGDCWLWAGSKTKDGYGVITVGRRQYRAHRISYEAHYGPVPDGTLVCHQCDTPLCINPEHLFLGTPKENTRDMISKGRANRNRGEKHHNNKIPPAAHSVIIERRKSGETLKQIASDYGVVFQTISEICLGRRGNGAR